MYISSIIYFWEVTNISLRKIERNIASGIGKIAKILTLFTILGFTIVFIYAYFTGNLEYLFEWFSEWLAEAITFSAIILIIASFIGIFSPKIAKALRKMSDF